jgi:ADP-heptose:LPS heptosyltransferase
MKRVLVANIFGIGDVLFTAPLIANLRKRFGNVDVGYLSNARTMEIAGLIPGVNDVFVYEKDYYTRLWSASKKRFFAELKALFGNIKKKKYEAVFDLTLSREFGLGFALAGVPKRIGLDYKRRGVFLTDKIPLVGFSGRHVAEHYLDLLGAVGVEPKIKDMRIVPDPALEGWLEKYLADKNIKRGKFVAVIPGGGASWGKQASRKRWYAEGFTQAADLIAASGRDIAVLGDSSEKDLAGYVASGMTSPPSVVETGLSLRQYVSVISAAELVLCNDGGPLHLASALGLKTVSVFGPVDDKVYGPYPFTERHIVIKAEDLSCRPCYDRFKLPDCEYDARCVTEISPRRVAEACMELLEKTDRP